MKFVFFVCLLFTAISLFADSFSDEKNTAEITFSTAGDVRQYTLRTTADLRDNQPADKTRIFSEQKNMPYLRSGSVMFDGLYAMALDDARLNAVDKIRDGSFTPTAMFDLPYYQTGEKWTHVWTRDVSYAVDLGLATLDQQRCINSLLFKTAYLKPGITGGFSRQIVQDTGSGGSYPVSTDRVVWAFAAEELLKYLDGADRENFINDAWEIIRNTIEHDRVVIFDETDGLYRGEQSFLDWRVQSYPIRTGKDVVLIAQSKSLSTNVGHYWLIKTGAKLAAYKEMAGYEKKYLAWADKLKGDINKAFYMEDEGQYSSLLLEDYYPVKVKRYDTLGQSLAIIYGVADEGQASRIISNYPHGKYGPAVIWPQDKNVPIYHNQGIWPFVTAYWLKAAKQVGNSDSVELSMYSLVRGAALNLSNMENFDFVTGRAYAKSNGIEGPVINSQRQLWSVAGYISMVQDVLFGMETSWDGIKFLPFVTPNMRSDYFDGSNILELNNINYHGKKITVKIYLPKVQSNLNVKYLIDKIVLNGKEIDDDYVSNAVLEKSNKWEIYLKGSKKERKYSVKLLEKYSGSAIFGPEEPGLQLKQVPGKPELIISSDEAGEACFRIYKNGRLAKDKINSNTWKDKADSFDSGAVFYAAEAECRESGNVSFITSTKPIFEPGDYYELTAANMKNTGGNLVGNHHFENWGLTWHTLEIDTLKIDKDGDYFVNVEYSNGSGQIYTGVTCAVKRIDIIDAATGSLVKSSYLIMPETEPDDGSSSGWEVYRDSTRFVVSLHAGTVYKVLISEDEKARNMSYFDHYIPYKRTGGGEKPYNYVNISKLKLLRK